MSVRVRIAGIVSLLVLAGCSASQSGTSSQASATANALAASASVAASPSPTASPSPSPGVAADLTTVLPTELGGVPLDRKSLTAQQVDGLFGGGLKYLAATVLKVDLADVQVAVGWGGASQGEQLVTAIRVSGADTATLQDAFKNGVDPGSIVMGAKSAPAAIGGKEVQAFGDPPATYLRFVDDVVFVVQTQDPAIAQEAFKALP
jgi:hypothetical protein